MKRAGTIIVTTILVLILSLSFLNAHPVVSQDNTAEALGKLRKLRDEVSDLPDYAFKNSHSAEGHRKALANKINAVIHQVEAGAIHGAINKLENDLINAVTNWVTPEFAAGLIDEINDIIDLLKGTQPDFAITAFPSSLTIKLGDEGATTIMIVSLRGFSKPVDLAVTAEPIDGVTFNFDPRRVTPPPNDHATSTLTVEVDTTATVGTYTVEVTGRWDAIEHGAEVSIEITETPPPPPEPDFALSAAPSVLTIEQGDSDESTVLVVSLKGFSGTVDLAVVSAPSGVVCTLDPTQVDLLPNKYGTSTLFVTVDASVPTGSYTVRVNGTSGTLEHSVDISLEVTALPPQPPEPTIKILSVLRVPETPNYDEDVTVIAQIESSLSPTDQVVLSYSINTIDWINVTMSSASAPYSAVIPHQPYQTTVNYKVYASNTAGKTDVSDTYSYVVVDSYAPTISDMSRSPISPNYNDTVTVVASVNEPSGASGVGVVLLELTFDSVQQNITMEIEEGKYKGIVDELPFGTQVEYRIFASDEADNWAVSDGASYTVDDKYPPTAVIYTPLQGSFLRLDVLVNVSGSDANFDRTELRIGGSLVETWTSMGSQIYEWKTKEAYSDGAYTVSLTVLDKAGNSKQAQVTVTVDNTAPTIETPGWEPRTPLAQEEVNVTVRISDNPMGSGVKDATLWYRNDTVRDWQSIPMTAVGGNWTATIPGQSGGSLVEFYIESSDNAGNVAEKAGYEFTTIVPTGVPLWLLLLIILILAAIGAAVYWTRRRWKKASGEVVPTPSPS